MAIRSYQHGYPGCEADETYVNVNYNGTKRNDKERKKANVAKKITKDYLLFLFINHSHQIRK
jgi:hypothetical protein